MISEREMQNVLSAALTTGGDFAELFFEDREETNIRSVNTSLQGVKKIRLQGVGLTVLSGIKSVYVYTNSSDYPSLVSLAEKAANMLSSSGNPVQSSPLTRQQFISNNKIEIYPSSVAYADKINVMRAVDKACRNASSNVSSLNVDYYDNDQKIVVANSQGLITSDRRVNCRLRFQITMRTNNGSYYEWDDYTKAKGFEAFSNMDECENAIVNIVKSVECQQNAVSAKPCRVPVVMASGACGTLWHECCGHGLEASAIASGQSIYCNMLGKKIASDKVTLYDDGTYPGLYGTSAVDDEGHPRQKNLLIENGILKNYMCDRLHGRMIGMESNGCGRKQNYTYQTTSRMSNTYLAPGNDDEKDIISSVPEGLYVQQLGGGTGGQIFTLNVKEGYWIKNGKIDHPVKGLSLCGNGIDVMSKVDMVGKTIETEQGGFCGAASGLIPVTAFQPMVRISEMSVSGEGDAK